MTGSSFTSEAQDVLALSVHLRALDRRIAYLSEQRRVAQMAMDRHEADNPLLRSLLALLDVQLNGEGGAPCPSAAAAVPIFQFDPEPEQSAASCFSNEAGNDGLGDDPPWLTEPARPRKPARSRTSLHGASLTSSPLFGPVPDLVPDLAPDLVPDMAPDLSPDLAPDLSPKPPGALVPPG